MKIIHLVSTYPPYHGGMGNSVRGMVGELQQRGHEVTVVTPKYWRRTGIFGAEVCPARPWLQWGNAALLPHLVWKLDDADVVHLHYPFFGGAEIAALWRFSQGRRGRPLVATYHMDAHAEGWQERLFRWHERRTLPWVMRQCDRIIVTSRDYAEHSALAKLNGDCAGRIVEIPLGVDEQRFAPGERDAAICKQWKIPADAQVLLFVGGLDAAHRFKGMETLLRAFSFYMDTRQKVGADVPCRLVIVGDGGDRPSYAALARELDIDRLVVFTGRVSDEDLPRYYQSADCTVLPSLSSAEAFGMVLVESMASGVPVIASYLAGVRTVVEDGMTGFLVKPGDIIGLGKMFHKALSDPERLRAMGEEGRKRVLEKYTWKKIGDALEGVYGEVNTRAPLVYKYKGRPCIG